MIFVGHIDGTAVVGVFSAHMRIKLDKSDLKGVGKIIVRIKTLGLLVKCLGSS